MFTYNLVKGRNHNWDSTSCQTFVARTCVFPGVLSCSSRSFLAGRKKIPVVVFQLLRKILQVSAGKSFLDTCRPDQRVTSLVTGVG